MKLTAMKRLSLLTMILGLAVALPAHADDWSKTYTLSGKPDLRVDTSDANIHVSTWDQNTIEARVTTTKYKIGDDGIRIEEHQTGDTVEIDVRFPHFRSHGITIEWGQHRVDVEIRMPREGKVNLRTGDGRIALTGLKGTMELESGDGSVELDAIDGQLRAKTSDGHIRARGRFDLVDVKTGDGRLDLTADAGSALASNWRLETGDGRVTLDIPEQLAADVDLKTGDGRIDLGIPVTTDGKIRDNEVHGKINGGGNLLVVRTGDGSIRIGKN
jgi:DUF4097 and DUF4098 domain-containing protein YvlB